jgi:hypothetical protein
MENLLRDTIAKHEAIRKPSVLPKLLLSPVILLIVIKVHKPTIVLTGDGCLMKAIK